MIHVGVLTYNVIRSLRDELLEQTLDSVERAFQPVGARLYLLDNGSDDGSDHDLATPGWFYHRRPGATSTTPGAGRNALMALMAPEPDDIVVLSDDDILWHPCAGASLRMFWDDPDNRITLASGLLEPEYPWSKPIEAVTVGGLTGLIRPSLPAAAWTFRARDWDKIGPLKETVEGDGEDFAACKKLWRDGALLLALDLCTHIGEGYSQMGNDEARRFGGRPIDRSDWGLPRA